MLNENFMWEPQPKAEKIIEDFVDLFCKQNAFIENLETNLRKHTSSRLFDWIDHIVVFASKELKDKIHDAGFQKQSQISNHEVFFHPGAQLPRIVFCSEYSSQGIAINVESIADFLFVRGLSRIIEGSFFSRYRRCGISKENGVSLWAVERRGSITLDPVIEQDEYLKNYFLVTEKWETRSRCLDDEAKAISETIAIIKEIVSIVDKNLAACIILQNERKYWESRNTAGQIQKDRQDRLGMGWANHDHHTFRSSRKHFKDLVYMFELLGFHCRERFYAGKEAGWGAQVMENPVARCVLFLDVDLDAHEISIDFAHQALPELQKLGTIGLWCALHGDSILHSGMHHLEAQFLFEDLKNDLLEKGIRMMDPFSNFSYLKQAFTAGEIWAVDSNRVNKLLSQNKIKEEEASRFLSIGAIGSHLENLQRRDGYKGFNQKNVSHIIKETDPRKIKYGG